MQEEESQVREANMALKILVVEDDPMMLELMCEVLASFEAEVRPMSDSMEAAALAERERFDGIFLDLNMPRLNGFQVASRARQSAFNRSTPIVIVTGFSDRKIMEQAFAVGGTFFLQKPVDRQKLAVLFKSARGLMFDNQRHHIRVPLELEVTCEAGVKVVKAKSVNISEGGILIDVAGLGPLKTTVRLSFQLPGRNPSNVMGVIVRFDEKKRHTGIQFTTITPIDKQYLREFIIDYLA